VATTDGSVLGLGVEHVPFETTQGPRTLAQLAGLGVPGLDADDAGVVIDHGAPGHVTTFGRAWDGPVVLDDQPSELGA